MKCVFCAEDIQDAAILCRFCGAEKKSGQWLPPARKPDATARPKGNFTIKTSAGLFALSGAYSLFTMTSAVPLFGAMRGGIVSIGYNLFYATFFLGLALGLWMRKSWGFELLVVGTIVYSLDKILFLLDPVAQKAYLAASGVTAEVGEVIDTSFINEAVILTNLAFIACWWGFVAYMYFRRDYFLRAAGLETSG